MPNPIGGLLRRLAKWLVKKGQEELDKELDKRREPPPQPPPSHLPPGGW